MAEIIGVLSLYRLAKYLNTSIYANMKNITLYSVFNTVQIITH